MSMKRHGLFKPTSQALPASLAATFKPCVGWLSGIIFVLLALAAHAAAQEPVAKAKLIYYRYEAWMQKTVDVEVEANVVKMSRGSFTVEFTSPVSGVAGEAIVNQGFSILSDYGLEYGPTRDVVPQGRRQIAVEMTPSKNMTIESQGVCELRGVYLTLADGSKLPLAAVFQPDYKKLPSSPEKVFESKHWPEPATEPMTTDAAKDMILLDWKSQAGNWSSAKLIEAVPGELRRIERLLERQKAGVHSEKWRELLTSLRQRAADVETYWQARALRRQILLADSEIDFSALIAIDTPFTGGGEAKHQGPSRTQIAAPSGARLLVLDGLGPDAAPRKLAPPDGQPGMIWRPDLSFDAKNVLYSMKAKDNGSFDLYEVGVNGGGARQITDSPEYDDLDPIYVPDGGIVFSTTRCNTYIPCIGSLGRSFALARCDMQGKDIYFISSNFLCDHQPTLLPDGRVSFMRWEYVDRNDFTAQGIWAVNPDGTSLNAFWGTQSQWPDLKLGVRAIPGSNRYLFNAVAHHFVYDGALAILDPREGLNYPDGLWNLTPHINWPEVGAGPKDRPWPNDLVPPDTFSSFLAPFPVSPNLFLVSARFGRQTGGYGGEVSPQRFGLYLMDYDGNMELLYRGSFNLLYAQPLRPRQAPPALPSSVRWPGRMKSADQKADDGLFFSADVYEGADIPRGMVKKLRVLEVEPPTFTDGVRSSAKEMELYKQKGLCSYFMSGETMVSFLYDESPKRILGTVPVEADGSVHFNVPSSRGVYFQLLDERGRCLQTMRTIIHAMPGEIRGCVGCHETRSTTPVATSASALAMKRPPSAIEQPAWGDASVSFPRFVQPILDKHCISCHDGKKKSGGYDLTHRTEPGTEVSWPYVELVFGKLDPQNQFQQSEAPKRSVAGPLFPYLVYPNPRFKVNSRETVPVPMTAMSYRSRLLEIAVGGQHNGVKISPEEENMLVAWIDTLTPYQGLEELLAMPDIPYDEWKKTFPTSFTVTYKPLMRTAPAVHRAFAQDEFKTQDDRIPKDADGNPLPSFLLENNRRVYRIPTN